MNINATLIGQTIAFIIFVWFCVKYVDTKNLVEQELLSAKVQAQEILDAANKRRNKVLDEVKAEAEELKAKIIAQGYAEVEAERKRVQEELRVKVASLAVAGAEKIVGRSIDEAANNDIIDKLVAEL